AGQLGRLSGVRPRFDRPFFKEFTLRVPGDVAAGLASVLEWGYHGGLALGRWYPELGDCVSVAVTVRRTGGEVGGEGGGGGRRERGAGGGGRRRGGQGGPEPRRGGGRAEVSAVTGCPGERTGGREGTLLRARFERVGRWLWLPAVVFGALGVIGLADLRQAE